ncbi:hypothetical protein B0H63DRAFT_510597 [Podospora didyma]|uniref:ABM domain-containing protein n=1 Tax=Podospora didyma TaxID=330526 RepID=A0AAE0U039_9PEZI|nr:hypothetical protein B0H63DRAFT_510597 [Podospora didyma]
MEATDKDISQTLLPEKSPGHSKLVSCISSIYVDASKTAIYEKFIAELMAYVQEHEPGCLEYRWKKLAVSEGDAIQKYLFFEKYVSMEAFEEGHLGSLKFAEGIELFTKEAVFTKMPDVIWFPEEDLGGSFSR